MVTKTKNRRGGSHIEVMLSFVIFLGFLLFLFAVFNPFKVTDKGEVYLNTLERNIIDNISTNVGFVSLKVNSEINDCFKIEKPEWMEEIIVKDEDQEFVNATSDGNIEINDDGKFYYIYSWENFDERDFQDSCGPIGPEDYGFGSKKTFQMVSNESLYEIKDRYVNDYENLKEGLKLPPPEEFMFFVRDIKIDEGYILKAERTRPEGISILARNVPIQIVYKNGEIKYALLNIQTW